MHRHIAVGAYRMRPSRRVSVEEVHIYAYWRQGGLREQRRVRWRAGVALVGYDPKVARTGVQHDGRAHWTDLDEDGALVLGVVHLDAILRCAHLIGVAGSDFLPRSLHFSESLDFFTSFYVNKYADHQSHELIF